MVKAYYRITLKDCGYYLTKAQGLFRKFHSRKESAPGRWAVADGDLRRRAPWPGLWARRRHRISRFGTLENKRKTPGGGGAHRDLVYVLGSVRKGVGGARGGGGLTQPRRDLSFGATAARAAMRRMKMQREERGDFPGVL